MFQGCPPTGEQRRSIRTRDAKHRGDVIRGEAVAKARPEFMDILRQTQEGEFLLLDGGRISTPVEHGELDAVDAAGTYRVRFVR